MNREDIEFLKDLMYSEDSDSMIEEIKNIKNPLFLHVISANYNWNNGLDIPHAIVANPCCDFGTGLLLFYHADGYRLLESQEAVMDSPIKDWKDFVIHIYNKILNDGFSGRNISFAPPLSKVQIFKLKKSNPSIPDVVLSKSPGDDVVIPIL
jgi:hypothetical protein